MTYREALEVKNQHGDTHQFKGVKEVGNVFVTPSDPDDLQTYLAEYPFFKELNDENAKHFSLNGEFRVHAIKFVESHVYLTELNAE